MTAAVLITSFSRWGAFLSKPTSPCVSKNFCHRGAIPWSDILNVIHTVPENSLGSSFGGRFDFVNKEFTRACRKTNLRRARAILYFDRKSRTCVCVPCACVQLNSQQKLTCFRCMRLLISWYFKRPVMY